MASSFEADSSGSMGSDKSFDLGEFEITSKHADASSAKLDVWTNKAGAWVPRDQDPQSTDDPSASGAWAKAWIDECDKFTGYFYHVPPNADPTKLQYPGQPAAKGAAKLCPYPGCGKKGAKREHVHSHYRDECHLKAMEMFANVLLAHNVTQCPWQGCSENVAPGTQGAAAFSSHLRTKHRQPRLECRIVDDSGRPCRRIVPTDANEHFEVFHGLIIDAKCGAYCDDCCRWTIGRKAANDHAESHVDAKVAAIAANARLLGEGLGQQMCPFCLTDVTKRPAQRMATHGKKHLKVHIADHIAKVSNRSSVRCPYPSCQPLTYPAHELADHFNSRHSIFLLRVGEVHCAKDLVNLDLHADTRGQYEAKELPWQL